MAQTLKKIYTDIDFSFTRIPGKNDIALSFDEMAVIRSIRYLLLTRNYERPFQPTIGSQLNALLFEPISTLTANQIRSEIENTIKNHEPRVNLVQVTINEDPDNNAYDVSLEFFIGNNSSPTAINLILERTR